MAHQFFSLPQTQQQMQEGPLGRYVNEFASLLHEQGYSIDYGRRQIRLVAHFSQWLSRHGLSIFDLSQQSIIRYLRYRRQTAQSGDQSTLNRLLSLLREKGICKQKPHTIVKSALQEQMDRFQNHLLERGLSPNTLLYYLSFTRQFLRDRFGKGAIQLSNLKANDITGYVQRYASSLIHERKQHLTTALRSFLRYLRYWGDIEINLAACVPAVANWKLSSLPKFIEPSQVRLVLDQCDRQTPKGLRDYAILLLLARLGLRAGEVVALILDDIHWESGELTIHDKGKNISRFPLPQEVGRAIAAYIKNGRPPCSTRRLFIRLHAPREGFASHIAISTLVKQALKQAGIHAPGQAAHLFRHSLATQMLRQGASLSEIAQILRHRQINTTSIYAKVDQKALRDLAQPWIGGIL